VLYAYGWVENFSYVANFLDQLILKDKSHFFVDEHEKLLLYSIIEKKLFYACVDF
jgi:hypothetical protein